MDQIKELLLNYGYIVIFGTLFLELIALPLPGEVMMTYAGFLVSQNHLSWLFCVIAAFLGTMAGMTTTYFIGRLLGRTFFHEYGHYFHMGPKQLEKASHWFEKYGDRLIVVAYFIPGVRHVTGYFSGISKLPYKDFALYAYSGGAFWVCVFISMGSILGDSWEKYHKLISSYLAIGGVIIAGIILLVLIYKYYREVIFNESMKVLKKAFVIFHSMGRMKIAIVVIGLLFVTIFAFAIESVQDYLTNQYDTFNAVIKYFTYRSFGHEWQGLFSGLGYITSNIGVVIIYAITLLWIYVHSKDKKLEYIFTTVAIGGGVALQAFLAKLFENSGVMRNLYLTSKTVFPGRESLIAISAIGFLTYMTIRHSGKVLTKALKISVAGVLIFLISIGDIYKGTLDPSSVIAGIEIGGAWLFLNIIFLEIFRVLPKVSTDGIEAKDS